MKWYGCFLVFLVSCAPVSPRQQLGISPQAWQVLSASEQSHYTTVAQRAHYFDRYAGLSYGSRMIQVTMYEGKLGATRSLRSYLPVYFKLHDNECVTLPVVSTMGSTLLKITACYYHDDLIFLDRAQQEVMHMPPSALWSLAVPYQVSFSRPFYARDITMVIREVHG